MRQLVKRISPSTVLAAAALFVALAGSSTAAVDNVTALITGAQIKNNSITGADVKNKSLTAADIKGRLQGPPGARGAAGPAGAAGQQARRGFSALSRRLPPRSFHWTSSTRWLPSARPEWLL